MASVRGRTNTTPNRSGRRSRTSLVFAQRAGVFETMVSNDNEGRLRSNPRFIPVTS